MKYPIISRGKFEKVDAVLDKVGDNDKPKESAFFNGQISKQLRQDVDKHNVGICICHRPTV